MIGAHVPSSLQRSFLDFLHVHVSLVLGSPVWTDHCKCDPVRAEQSRRLTLLPWSSGNSFPSAIWHLLAAYIPKVLTRSCSTRCSPGSPGPLLECSFPPKHHLACTGEYLGFLPPQEWDLAFAFAWLWKSLAGQDLQPSDMPQEWQHNPMAHLVYQQFFLAFHTRKSDEDPPYSIIQVISEDVTVTCLIINLFGQNTKQYILNAYMHTCLSSSQNILD